MGDPTPLKIPRKKGKKKTRSGNPKNQFQEIKIYQEKGKRKKEKEILIFFSQIQKTDPHTL